MINNDYRDVARDFLRLCGIAEERPGIARLGRLAREFGRLPYENFSKIVRAAEFEGMRRIRTPEIVLADHLDLGTGGTCFSLTHFFRQVLAFSGFDADPVLCDRSYGPDTHCALIVRMGGARFLVDPGYLMQEPIEIPESGESTQHGPWGRLILKRLGDSRQFVLLSERDGAHKVRYRLRDEAVSDESFLARWVDSFGWSMMRHMCASRQTQDGQLYMRDGRLRRLREGEKRQVRLDSGFADEVERVFGIDRSLVSMAHDALKGPR